jgi:hypothetical protein
MDLLENIIIVLRTINYIIENKERIKKLILWLNKKIFGDNNSVYMENGNHPNTPFTFNGNQFVAHI